MTLLLAGLIVFLGVHSVSIVGLNFRDRMVAKMGEGPWKGLFGVISLLALVLIVKGYAMARVEPTVLYLVPAWLQHVSVLLMLLVFPLLFAAYFPGRIKTTLQHPMLVAVKVWALAHLLANGTLADVLLFGSFLVWAVADRISVKRRAPRPMPELLPKAWNDGVAVVGGLLVYVAFLVWLHPLLIGVAVIG